MTVFIYVSTFFVGLLIGTLVGRRNGFKRGVTLGIQVGVVAKKHKSSWAKRQGLRLR